MIGGRADILFTGMTKDGRSECTEDSQCYTKCSKKTKSCTQPWWDFEQVTPHHEGVAKSQFPLCVTVFKSQIGRSERIEPPRAVRRGIIPNVMSAESVPCIGTKPLDDEG